jgi:AhpD family alkylhydroperoxidase
MQQGSFDTTIDRVWRLPERLGAVRPEAADLLDTANECAWRDVDPVLLELMRLRIGALIGNEQGVQRRSVTARERGLTEDKIAALSDYAASAAFSEQEKDCLAFTEQFVIDVSGVTDVELAGLQRHFPEDRIRAFVVALYVTECTQRLEMTVPALLGTSPEDRQMDVAVGQTNTTRAGGDATRGLQQVMRDYQEAVVRGTALDPMTTELVRLRCARTHDCRICKTLRLADARMAGVDDAMTSKVDFYEQSDLDERTKIALRITDAFITRPDTLPVAVMSEARETFSIEELAELCLDITKWSTQKIHVSLGTDTADALPTNEQGVSFFTFDQDGRVAGFSGAPRQGETPAVR